MEDSNQKATPHPPDCFRLEELELFQSFEQQVLAEVTYYLWMHVAKAQEQAAFRFLFSLELIFESRESLILSSGDDSEAIRVISVEKLLETATQLQQLHGQPVIQRMGRNEQGIWPAIIGNKMEGVQLARHESGLYRNDALLLNFGAANVVVELTESEEGLQIRER